jgi:hypothetical protein
MDKKVHGCKQAQFKKHTQKHFSLFIIIVKESRQERKDSWKYSIISS